MFDKNILNKKLLNIILFNNNDMITNFNYDNDYICYYIKEQIWDDVSKYFRYVDSDVEYKINIYQFIDKCEKYINKNDYCISTLISDYSVCSDIYNHNMIGGILYKNMKDNKIESIIDCVNWIFDEKKDK